MPVSKKRKHGKGKKNKRPLGLPQKPPKSALPVPAAPAPKMEFKANDDTPGNRLLKIGIDIGRQQVVDMLCFVLNDKDIMHKDVFGKNRLVKVCDGLNHYLNDVFPDAYGQEEETYYQRVKMDEGLRAIVGDELFVPFLQRYPRIKDCDL